MKDISDSLVYGVDYCFNQFKMDKPFSLPINNIIASSNSYKVNPPSLDSFCKLQLGMSKLQYARLNHLLFQLKCLIRECYHLPNKIVFRDSSYPRWVFHNIDENKKKENYTKYFLDLHFKVIEICFSNQLNWGNQNPKGVRPNEGMENKI